MAGPYICPECSKEFDLPGKVTLHRISVHGYRSSSNKKKPDKGGRTIAPPAELPRATEAQIEADCREAVGFVQGLGGLVKMGAPHLGTAIMGVEVPKGQPTSETLLEDGRYWLVRSRAVMALPTLTAQAKQNVQVYSMVRAWIQFCKSGQLVEAGAGLVAAAAVDVGVSPEFGLKVGPFPIQPIPMVIPDVLEWVKIEQDQQVDLELAQPRRPAPAPENGAVREREAELVGGGVTDT